MTLSLERSKSCRRFSLPYPWVFFACCKVLLVSFLGNLRLFWIPGRAVFSTGAPKQAGEGSLAA